MLTKDENPETIRQKEGGPFQQRIAEDGGLRKEIEHVIEKTIRWPSFTQSVKSVITADIVRSWRYAMEKRQKATAGRSKPKEDKEKKEAKED